MPRPLLHLMILLRDRLPRGAAVLVGVPRPRRSVLQAVLGGIDLNGRRTRVGHGVGVVLDVERLVVQRDLPLADAKEAADADDDGCDLAVLIKNKVIDFADGFVLPC